MRLYLVRHGNPAEPDGDDDAPDPGLTEEGRESVAALGRWMVENDERPACIFASPALRTQETAEILRDAFGLPSVELAGSIGPAMSIRKKVLSLAADRTTKNAMLVSHHETIAHGLRALNLDPAPHLDLFAEAEMRRYRIDRESGTWKERLRVPPSDLKNRDNY